MSRLVELRLSLFLIELNLSHLKNVNLYLSLSLFIYIYIYIYLMVLISDKRMAMLGFAIALPSLLCPKVSLFSAYIFQSFHKNFQLKFYSIYIKMCFFSMKSI